MTPTTDARLMVTLNAVEARAREIGGGIHVHGAIPASCWRQAIAERFLGEPVRDAAWAERIIAGPDTGDTAKEPRDAGTSGATT